VHQALRQRRAGEAAAGDHEGAGVHGESVLSSSNGGEA
jgi:hypothetical protein